MCNGGIDTLIRVDSLDRPRKREIVEQIAGTD